MTILGRVKLERYSLLCDCCGYEWTSNEKKIPKVCPKCKNPNWNREDEQK